MKSQTDPSNFSTRPDDILTDEICDLVLGKLIENLSKSISLEFSKGTSSETLFCMPKLEILDLQEKATLARDLSKLLFNTRHLRDSVDLRSSLESIKNFQGINQSDKDILQVLKAGSEVQLSKKEARDLVRLIFLQCNQSESWKFKTDLTEIQDLYIFVSRKLKNAEQEDMLLRESVKEESQYKENLKSETKVWKQQVELVGKQIEDILIEQYILDEQTHQLELEIEEAKIMLKSIGITHFEDKP